MRCFRNGPILGGSGKDVNATRISLVLLVLEYFCWIFEISAQVSKIWALHDVSTSQTHDVSEPSLNLNMKQLSHDCGLPTEAAIDDGRWTMDDG